MLYMINIKNIGTLKNLTKVISTQGYDLASMRYDVENSELIIKYNNKSITDDYVWEITINANVQEEEYGVPTIIDITKISMENTGKSV